MTNVQDDLVSIISDGSLGWNNGNCATPDQIQVIQDAQGYGVILEGNVTAVLVDNALYDNEILNDQFTVENLVYTLKVTIVGNSRTYLEDAIIETQRIGKKYSQVRGTGFTTSGYDILLIKGLEDMSNISGTVFKAEGFAQLVKQFRDVSV